MSETRQDPGPQRATASDTRQPATLPGDASRAPWWRVGMMWLVIGGPLTVVVAGVATAVIATRGADPVLTPAERGGFAERPAISGRNHAVSGQVPGAGR